MKGVKKMMKKAAKALPGLIKKAGKDKTVGKITKMAETAARRVAGNLPGPARMAAEAAIGLAKSKLGSSKNIRKAGAKEARKAAIGLATAGLA